METNDFVHTTRTAVTNFSQPAHTGEVPVDFPIQDSSSSSAKDLSTLFVEKLTAHYPLIAEAFKDVLNDQLVLFAKKHLDYGIWNLAAGTRLETAQDVGFALEGIWFRLSDKVNRWRNIMLTGNVNNESLQDTFKDIANYAMIAQIIASGNWKDGKKADQ